MSANPTLKPTLGPLMIWALGVGYVISGMYFGWNLGLPLGGTTGMLAATALVTTLYVAFVLVYGELASAIPHAGGAFEYGKRAFGPTFGLAAGLAQWIEFVFAPPAIAAAIGAYFKLFFPAVPAWVFATAAYVLFTAVNIWGLALSAWVELLFTVLAVAELLVFFGVTAPHFSFAAFGRDGLPNGMLGMFDAIPFAVWFYLGIEGIANVAEEAKNPARDVPRGFLSAMATLAVLAFAVLCTSVGVAGWRSVVFAAGSDTPSDSPLPLALAQVVGKGHPLFHMLVVIGLFGLVASFHGIILAAGRVTMEFGRARYLPRVVGSVHSTRRTPVAALLLNLVVGLVALASGRTDQIITLAVLGALVLYATTSASHIRLRARGVLNGAYRAPGGVVTPLVACVLSAVAIVAVARSAPWIALIYAAITATGLLVARVVRSPDVA